MRWYPDWNQVDVSATGKLIRIDLGKRRRTWGNLAIPARSTGSTSSIDWAEARLANDRLQQRQIRDWQ